MEREDTNDEIDDLLKQKILMESQQNLYFTDEFGRKVKRPPPTVRSSKSTLEYVNQMRGHLPESVREIKLQQAKALPSREKESSITTKEDSQIQESSKIFIPPPPLKKRGNKFKRKLNSDLHTTSDKSISNENDVNDNISITSKQSNASGNGNEGNMKGSNKRKKFDLSKPIDLVNLKVKNENQKKSSDPVETTDSSTIRSIDGDPKGHEYRKNDEEDKREMDMENLDNAMEEEYEGGAIEERGTEIETYQLKGMSNKEQTVRDKGKGNEDEENEFLIINNVENLERSKEDLLAKFRRAKQKILDSKSENEKELKDSSFISSSKETITAKDSNNDMYMSHGQDDAGYFRVMIGETIMNGRFKVLKRLGGGMYSNVFAVEDIGEKIDKQNQNAESSSTSTKSEDNNIVALKVLRNNPLIRIAGTKEINTLQTVLSFKSKTNNFCLKFLEAFDIGPHLAIMVEAMECDLYTLIQNEGKGGGLLLDDVLTFSKQILGGLSYLHGKQLVHTDLKPQNILFSGKPRPLVKIGDFGCTMTTEEVFDDVIEKGNQFLQPRYWRAPEVILGMTLEDLSLYTRIDIWSLGIVILHMYTGQIIFKDATDNHELLKLVAELMPNGGETFSRKILKKCSSGKNYFTSDMEYLLVKTKENDHHLPIRLKSLRQRKNISQIVNSIQKGNSNKTKVQSLSDAICKCLVIDPQGRESAKSIVSDLMRVR